MGAIVAVVGASLILIVMVIVLSLITINKGYGYKHTVDPHPDDEKNESTLKEKE